MTTSGVIGARMPPFVFDYLVGFEHVSELSEGGSKEKREANTSAVTTQRHHGISSHNHKYGNTDNGVNT